MKKLTAALVVVVLVVILVVVILGSGEDECDPGGGHSVPVASGGLAQPMEDAINHITSYYRTPERPDHRGVDIGKPNGEAIFAMADGVVAAAGPADGFGQWIVIDHEIDGKPYSTVYGHMYPNGVHVKTGDQVKAGQHIADEGSNGQSSGPHLHFEVWEGSRLRGGNETDPTPWIQRAAEGGSVAAGPDQAEARKPHTSKDGGGELPPSDKVNEDHLQVDAIRVARAVAQRFPEVQTIGGWRPNDPYPDHPSGRAIDVMIPDYNSGEGKALGDAVRDYLYGNREFFQIEYMIWRQEYIPAAGSPNMMEDRGSDTQNHFDHVHVTVKGGGFPTPDQKYGAAPAGGSNEPGASASADGSDCIPPAVGDASDGDLNEGQVPAEFVKWIKLGGRVCPEISPALLAGQIEQESQWNVNAGSPAGAQGPSQFMPGTWATWGFKVDDNGEKIGPPGGGDIHSPADATMAQARLMCDHATTAKQKLESGAWHGDLVELALAAYNAGEGNVDNYGGIPPFAETQHYVKVIPEKATKYRV